MAKLEHPGETAAQPAPRAPRDAGRLARLLAFASLGVGIIGGVVGAFPATIVVGAGMMGVALAIFTVAVLLGSRAPAETREETAAERSARGLREHAFAALAAGIFLLVGLIEIVSIPASLGQLAFFGAVALGLIQLYSGVAALLLGLLVALLFAALRSPSRTAPTKRRAAVAYVSLAVALAIAVGGVLVALGLAGLKPERAIFVFAGSEVALYLFARASLGSPSFRDVVEWMEEDEHAHRSGVLRRAGTVFLVASGVAVLAAALSAIPAFHGPLGILMVALACILLLPAVGSIGVGRIVEELDRGVEGFEDLRKKRRSVLVACTIALTAVATALSVIMVLAIFAQFLGFEVFRALLEAFVANYPIVLAAALLAPAAVAVVRQRVPTTEKYTDARRAATVLLGLFTIVFAFFGAFIGSGLAQGTGIEIENAVIVMGAAVVSLTFFAKTRLLLPTVFGLVKEAIEKSKHATTDKDLQQNIQRSMITTYVVALVFVLGFVAFFAATALHVVPSPTSGGGGVGVEGAFFVYLLLGLALLVVLLVRYFQSANIDPRWKKKDEDIGKKRITPAEFQRYLILGFSITFATILFALGVLVQMGTLGSLGGIPLAPKFATDFWVFAILIGLGPYSWYYNREQKRIQAIDQKFPEFLRDLAESQRAGMTLTEAVLTTAKGRYGMLTPEIRKMAAQIEWGVSFTDAFERFGKRVRTPLIERTVALVVQAANAGGNVVDVLTAAADDAREIQQILKERKGSMSIYVMVIYVSFFVFMGVIGVLNAQFIPEVSKAVSKAAGVSIGGLHFTKIDEQAFKTLFFHAAIVQGLGGGLVAGVMEGGKPVTGLKHAFIMIAISYLVFRFLIGA